MKEFIAHYYLFDQKDEPRTLTIKANTVQDAVIIFNVQFSKSYTLVHMEEKHPTE